MCAYPSRRSGLWKPTSTISLTTSAQEWVGATTFDVPTAIPAEVAPPRSAFTVGLVLPIGWGTTIPSLSSPTNWRISGSGFAMALDRLELFPDLVNEVMQPFVTSPEVVYRTILHKMLVKIEEDPNNIDYVSDDEEELEEGLADWDEYEERYF